MMFLQDATMNVTLHAATVTSENSHLSVFYAAKKTLESEPQCCTLNYIKLLPFFFSFFFFISTFSTNANSFHLNLYIEVMKRKCLPTF